MKLPTVRIFTRVRNPNFVPDGSLPYEERMKDFYISHETNAEILTLHLNTGKMRIRYVDAMGKKRTEDISSNAFFQNYEITQK